MSTKTNKPEDIFCHGKQSSFSFKEPKLKCSSSPFDILVRLLYAINASRGDLSDNIRLLTQAINKKQLRK